MNVLHGLDGLRQLPPGAVLSIGNFDGVHRGHQRILEIARTLRDGERAAGRPSDLAVVTFEPHPLTVLRPQAVPPRLTSPAMKQELLESAGVDQLVILPPSPDILNVTAEDFWALLRDEVKPAHLVEGQSFTFGKGAKGTSERLRQWTAGSGIQLHVPDPVQVALLDLRIVPVSSSMVRWLLDHGRARDAAICLGRPYVLEGPVVVGHRRGRSLGFPTANLDCAGQMIPLDGVYAGRCTLDGVACPAALSIGTMPTFGENARQVEAHFIGFDGGELYGRTLRVEVLDWLREQWKFAGVEALKDQMTRDLAAARACCRHVRCDPIAAVTT